MPLFACGRRHLQAAAGLNSVDEEEVVIRTVAELVGPELVIDSLANPAKVARAESEEDFKRRLQLVEKLRSPAGRAEMWAEISHVINVKNYAVVVESVPNALIDMQMAWEMVSSYGLVVQRT